jgi:hypothetical protein
VARWVKPAAREAQKLDPSEVLARIVEAFSDMMTSNVPGYSK